MKNYNLFTNWLEIELTDKTLAETLRLLNEACGTSYKHNWPSKMAAADYTLERLPKEVRKYMMNKVLPVLTKQGYTKKELKDIVDGLT